MATGAGRGRDREGLWGGRILAPRCATGSGWGGASLLRDMGRGVLTGRSVTNS